MNLIQAYVRMWKKAFDFKSRATRKEFWFVFLVNYIISFVLSLIRSVGSAISMPFMNMQSIDFNNINDLEEMMRELMHSGTGGYMIFNTIISGIMTLYTIAVIIPTLSLYFRRFHDAGKSGVLYLILSFVSVIAPMIGMGVAIFAIIQSAASSMGSNGDFNPSSMIGALILFGFTSLASLVCSIIIIVICCLKSKPDNKYGPDPYGPNGEFGHTVMQNQVNNYNNGYNQGGFNQNGYNDPYVNGQNSRYAPNDYVPQGSNVPGAGYGYDPDSYGGYQTSQPVRQPQSVNPNQYAQPQYGQPGPQNAAFNAVTQNPYMNQQMPQGDMNQPTSYAQPDSQPSQNFQPDTEADYDAEGNTTVLSSSGQLYYGQNNVSKSADEVWKDSDIY